MALIINHRRPRIDVDPQNRVEEIIMNKQVKYVILGTGTDAGGQQAAGSS
jgi:hypothetical protein